MTKRIVHTADGKRISKSKFEEICRERDCQRTIIGGREIGNHVFTTYDQYDSFLRNHPLTASRHLASLERDKIWQSAVDQLGRRKAMALNARKNKLLQGINETVERLLGGAEVDSIEDQIVLVKSLVSQKMGSVFFFKKRNFTDQFAVYEGLAHVDMPTLDTAWDKKLSSIFVSAASCGNNLVMPTRIVLYQEQCYREGPAIDFWGVPAGHSYLPGGSYYYSPVSFTQAIDDLYPYGWDDRVSSWKFG